MHRKTRVRPKSVFDCSQAVRCTQAQNLQRPFCRTRTKADLPSSSATAYTLQVLDSLIKIVNYIKSGDLSFSGTSVSYIVKEEVTLARNPCSASLNVVSIPDEVQD